MFQDTFSKIEFDLGLTSLMEHTIDVGGHPSIKQGPHSVPVAFASEEENVIKQLEELGFIQRVLPLGQAQFFFLLESTPA